MGYTQNIASFGIFQVLPASEVQCHYLQTQVATLCKQDPDPLASVPTEEPALGLPAYTILCWNSAKHFFSTGSLVTGFGEAHALASVCLFQRSQEEVFNGEITTGRLGSFCFFGFFLFPLNYLLSS